MMIDLAWVFPRFAIASVDARMKAFAPGTTAEERDFYLELAGYLERASETPRDQLAALHHFFCCSDFAPPSRARAAAADFIDQVIDELGGKVHVPN